MFRQQQRHQVDLDTARAWEIANFVRAKKLPDLKKYLAKRERDVSGQSKVQTPQEMKSVFASLGYKAQPLSEEARRATKLKVQ